MRMPVRFALGHLNKVAQLDLSAKWLKFGVLGVSASSSTKLVHFSISMNICLMNEVESISYIGYPLIVAIHSFQ